MAGIKTKNMPIPESRVTPREEERMTASNRAVREMNFSYRRRLGLEETAPEATSDARREMRDIQEDRQREQDYINTVQQIQERAELPRFQPLQPPRFNYGRDLAGQPLFVQPGNDWFITDSGLGWGVPPVLRRPGPKAITNYRNKVKHHLL